MRPSIESGDVLSFRGSAPFSRAIRLYQRWEDPTRPYNDRSHVGLAIWIRSDDGLARLCCLEAYEGWGVRLVPLSWLLGIRSAAGEPVWWHRLECWEGSDDQIRLPDRGKVIVHALSRWGHRYASPSQFMASFGLVARAIRRRLGLAADLDATREFCSELAAYALRAGGYIPKRAAALTTPADLLNFRCVGPGVELSGG